MKFTKIIVAGILILFCFGFVFFFSMVENMNRGKMESVNHQEADTSAGMEEAINNNPLEQYLQTRPDIEAQILYHKQFIFAPHVGLSRRGRETRNNLLECAMQTPTNEMPSYEEDQIQNRCANKFDNTYHPFRREQNVAKLIYCLVQQSDVNNALDVFASYGGASLILSAGLLKAQKKTMKNKEAKVYGFEMNEFVCRFSQKRLKDYPSEIICGKTMDDFDYDPAVRANPSATVRGNNIAKLYANTAVGSVDVVLFDPPYSGASKWRDGSIERTGAEFYMILNEYQPKYIVLFNIQYGDYSGHPHNNEFQHVLETHESYDLIVEGVSLGLGCRPENQDTRKWSIFGKK